MFNAIKKLFSKQKRAMVYYGQNISYDKLEGIEYIIVQPDYIDTTEKQFLNFTDNIYAYVSIGEISKNVKEYKKIHQDWIIAKNDNWDSEVLDIRNKDYQKFLFDEIIDPIISLGFKNLFFDTLDSYNLAATTKQEKMEFELTLVNLIEKIHSSYPEAKLILNRGFEIIDRVPNYIQAVLFESYYFGLGSEVGTYIKISDSDREWLDIQIEMIKHLGIDIIALDYLDELNMEQAAEAIEIIKKSGMIPYISNRNLDIYGRSL